MAEKTEILLAAWGAFFVAHAISIQKIEQRLSLRAPLTLHEYDVLLMVERSVDRRLRYSEVASKSLFTKSGITRIMKRLEVRGLIERQRCESDGRGAFAKLSKQGEKALKDTWTVYSSEIIKILDPALTINEAKNLEMLMEKILSQVNTQSLINIRIKKDK